MIIIRLNKLLMGCRKSPCVRGHQRSNGDESQAHHQFPFRRSQTVLLNVQAILTRVISQSLYTGKCMRCYEICIQACSLSFKGPEL
jgi:hypothetical protein